MKMAESNSYNNDNTNRNKKKKKNFMSHTKSCAKQGQYGLGVELKEDEYNFFMALSNKLKTVTNEEKGALVRSFFSEFTGESGQRYVCNQIVSRMLDDLLPHAIVESVQHIITVLSADLWTMCTDPFASHVLQSVLVVALKYIQNGATQTDYNDEGCEVEVPVTEDERNLLQEFIIKMAKYCFNNLHDFISETYASHVVRSLLEVLSGVASSARGSRRAQTKHQLATPQTATHLQVPDELTEMLLMMADRLMKVADLPNIISSQCGSALYQCALQVLKPHHLSTVCRPLATHVLTHGIAPLTRDQMRQGDEEDEEDYGLEGEGASGADDIHPVFTTIQTCRLLEAVIECSDDSQLSAIYSGYFSLMARLVQDGVANFAVQRLLRAWGDGDTFKEVSDDVASCLGAVLSSQHTGVLLAWVQAAGRLAKEQGACCVAMMESLHCYTPEERQGSVSPLLVYMTTYEDYTSNGGHKVSLHGSLVLQEMLRFKKPIKLVKSLLQLPASQLMTLMQDPRGCHVSDAFCSSETIGEKSRASLVEKIKDDAVTLACSKHGSRSLEAVWGVACPAARGYMRQRMTDSAARMKGNEYGAILYNKFHVRRRGEDLQRAEELDQLKDTKRKQIKDLQCVTEAEPQRKKKKRKSKREELDEVRKLLDE